MSQFLSSYLSEFPQFRVQRGSPTPTIRVLPSPCCCAMHNLLCLLAVIVCFCCGVLQLSHMFWVLHGTCNNVVATKNLGCSSLLAHRHRHRSSKCPIHTGGVVLVWWCAVVLQMISVRMPLWSIMALCVHMLCGCRRMSLSDQYKHNTSISHTEQTWWASSIHGCADALMVWLSSITL